MSRFSRRAPRLLMVFVLLVVMVAPPAAAYQDSDPPFDSAIEVRNRPSGSTCDPDGVQASGAIYRLCMPDEGAWNGDLVIWAHGYVAFNEPVAIPEDQLCAFGDLCIPDIMNGLGYGFATTSYSVNGLAIQQGIADIVDLVDIFAEAHGEPNRVFLTGASEGGIITALSLERHPDIFNGGVAACGPVGDFRLQTNSFGDFRAVFDSLFPGLLPGDPLVVPQWLIDAWDFYYPNVIKPVVFDPANEGKIWQLVEAINLPYDVNNVDESLEKSIYDGLWYAVFATNDAREKLGGSPFDNMSRIYREGDPRLPLNFAVRRIGANPAAIGEIEAMYQTTGQLQVPLVTLHTLYDQQVPYSHEAIYRRKILENGAGSLHVNIPIDRYEHCNFTVVEALLSYFIMIFLASGQTLDMQVVQQMLPKVEDQAQFLQLVEQYVPASLESMR